MQKPKISVRKVRLGNKEYNQIVGQRVFSADDGGEVGWAKVWRGNNWNLTFRRVIKGCTSESPRRTSGKEIVVGDFTYPHLQTNMYMSILKASNNVHPRSGITDKAEGRQEKIS